jgi:hypothetical protein
MRTLSVIKNSYKVSMHFKTGQPRQVSQNGTAKTGQSERDSQDRSVRTGQPRPEQSKCVKEDKGRTGKFQLQNQWNHLKMRYKKFFYV